MPYGKYQYVKALETRVAELETLLATAGLTDSGKDHWETVLRSDTFNEINPPLEIRESGELNGMAKSISIPESKQQQGLKEESKSPVQFLKDLSLEAGGGYVGEGSSNITVGNMFRSIVRGREIGKVLSDGKVAHLSPKSISPNKDGGDFADFEPESDILSRVPDEIAQILLKAYFKHVSTRWVAIYKPQIRHLHDHRAHLVDPFEISTLNLVYAIAGRFLETTGEVPS
jgi:hypothetical protein